MWWSNIFEDHSSHIKARKKVKKLGEKRRHWQSNNGLFGESQRLWIEHRWVKFYSEMVSSSVCFQFSRMGVGTRSHRSRHGRQKRSPPNATYFSGNFLWVRLTQGVITTLRQGLYNLIEGGLWHGADIHVSRYSSPKTPTSKMSTNWRNG